MKDEAVTREDRVANLKGMGCSRKRVEDARFTQGGQCRGGGRRRPCRSHRGTPGQ